MRSKGFIIFSIILMVLIIQLIIIIIGIFYMNWFGVPNNNYVKYENSNFYDRNIYHNRDNTDDTKSNLISNNKSITNSTTSTTIYKKYDVSNLSNDKNTNQKFTKSTNEKMIKKTLINKDLTSDNETKYSKEGYVVEQTFHSYGEYISPDEYKYRLSMVNNLKIKTVIIDSLTKGNGVSQEFFRVVYENSMIPAKILEEVVESKEFRSLIPKKYLTNETKIKGLPKGEKIVFKNQDIKDLLVLWTMGKLTPYQKAWITKAEKK